MSAEQIAGAIGITASEIDIDAPLVVVSQKLVSGKVNRTNLAFSSSDVYSYSV